MNKSINNKFADGAMVRHSSDESEAPVMAGDYSQAMENRCVLRCDRNDEVMLQIERR